MKQIMNSVLLTALILLSSCSEKINSQWKTGIEIDGQGQDWDGVPLQYNENLKIVYGIVNNEKSLNVIVRFNDPAIARQFAMRGVTLWFNDENKKDKQSGIHYKAENSWAPLSAGMRGRGQKTRGNETGQRMMPLPSGNFTFARKDTLTGMPVSEMKGWQAAAGFADGLYTYEFQVPLERLADSTPYLNISGKQKIKVGLEIAAMTREERAALKEQMAGRDDAMMAGGGRRGGGMSGGMRGAGRGGRGASGGPSGRGLRQDTGAKEMWITVTLAQKQH